MAMGDRDGSHEPRRPYLPSGYALDEMAKRVDFVVLRRPDGSEVATFRAMGADPVEIEQRAWQDFGGGARARAALEAADPGKEHAILQSSVIWKMERETQRS